jgi:hypothetical protein
MFGFGKVLTGIAATLVYFFNGLQNLGKAFETSTDVLVVHAENFKEEAIYDRAQLHAERKAARNEAKPKALAKAA